MSAWIPDAAGLVQAVVFLQRLAAALAALDALVASEDASFMSAATTQASYVITIAVVGTTVAPLANR